ncbi:hypothetical protein Tco_1370362 [Tanacetum coccineum]
MVQTQEEVGEGSTNPTDPHHTPTIIQPSTSQPKKKHPRKSKKKNTEVPQPSDSTDDVADENEPTHSNDPLLSGEDRLKLNELMELYTNLSQRVLDLEKIKTSQAAKITELKEMVKKLEKKGGSRTHWLKRLYKVGRSARVVSSEDEGLGDQEDASKQERKINEIDQDAKDMVEKEVDMAENDVRIADPVTTAGEVVTTANAEVTTDKPSEFTTTTTTTTIAASKPSEDKGKAKMIKPEKPLKKKDYIIKEDANIAEWDDVQAMMDADYELAARLHADEQGELTLEEKSKLFVELMNKRKKHFARFRAEEQRRKPPTKAQKINTIETRAEGSSKRAGEKLESENLKKQKLDENEEAEVDDDQEEADMKKHMEIVPDDEVAIDAIPLATKPPIIVD